MIGANSNKMEQFMEDVEKLINVLDDLYKEVESYDNAKQNLIETKNELVKFIQNSESTSHEINKLLIGINELSKSNFIDRISENKDLIENLGSIIRNDIVDRDSSIDKLDIKLNENNIIQNKILSKTSILYMTLGVGLINTIILTILLFR